MAPIQHTRNNGETRERARQSEVSEENTVELHFCKLESVSMSVNEWIELLPEDEKAQARRYFREEDRLRFCIGRLMLRTLLAQNTGRAPESIVLDKGPHEKPYMTDGPSFNLSHSGSTVLVGIAASGDLGVDVEAVRPVDSMGALARSCLSDREQESFATCADGEKMRAFFRAWTRKEAFVKALGVGLKTSLKNFSVALDDRTGNALLDAQACCPDAQAWSIMSAHVPGAFEAAVAWNRPFFKLNVHEFDLTIFETVT